MIIYTRLEKIPDKGGKLGCMKLKDMKEFYAKIE